MIMCVCISAAYDHVYKDISLAYDYACVYAHISRLGSCVCVRACISAAYDHSPWAFLLKVDPVSEHIFLIQP
jgi:hypothetical protein